MTLPPSKELSYQGLAASEDGKVEEGKSAGPPGPEDSFTKKNLRGCAAIFCHPLNVLLIFVPMGVASKYAGWNSAAVFATNFMAIVPLASILGASTEVLATHTGQLIGGLLNATFGNAVEMIMCVQAVKSNLIRVVQGNLLGSILSNLLLVLGMAIFAASIKNSEAAFNPAGAAANMSCQILASISIALPTMYASVEGSTADDVLMLSRMCAVFLAITYFLFLIFQLKTHAHLFLDEGGGEEEEEADLSASVAVVLLAASTLIVAACSECLVDSIEDVSEHFGLPKAFIGVILLPIVGNAAEHSTAVVCAYKGMMDLALGVAVGSSTQIALFVVPSAVLFGWMYDKPMTLNFRAFDSSCMMLAVFLTSQVLQHGNANWLHGAMLTTTYLLIAIICWFIPE